MNYKNTFCWYFYNSYSRTASWSGVEYLYNFITQKDKRIGPFAIEVQPDRINAGDIIQLSFDGISFTHSVIVVKRENENILTATHSIDAYERNLLTYPFKQLRCLHIKRGYHA